LRAVALAIGKLEVELQRPAHQRRRQFDQRHAIIALDRPARCEPAQPRQRARLHGVERLGAFVRRAQREIARNAGVDRAAVAIGEAYRQHRAGAPIGDQVRLISNDPGFSGGGGEMHIARQPLGFAAIGITDNRGQVDHIALDADAAPGADRPAATGRALDRIESDLGNGLAVGEQFDFLRWPMPDHHADGGRARVVIDGGKKEAIRAIADCQPVGFRARCRTIRTGRIVEVCGQTVTIY
jgi:hypothetical protein